MTPYHTPTTIPSPAAPVTTAPVPAPISIPAPTSPAPRPAPTSTPTRPVTPTKPTPAPTLSPQERIARTWEMGKVGNSKLQMATAEKPTHQQLVTAAQRCLTYLAAAKVTNPEQRCKTTPVLIVTGKQGFGRESGQHMSTVSKSRPTWVTLNYMSSAQRFKAGVDRRWYAAKGFQHQCPAPRAAGKQCDEFPFYATVEGGPKAARAVPSVLQLIDELDNRRVGRTYQQMISPCGIQSATSTAPGRAARPAAGGKSQFLVIPVPAVTAVPSFWMCRK